MKERPRAIDTAERYEFLWKRSRAGYGIGGLRHVERISSLLGEAVFDGKLGIDAGSGMGDDTEYLAQRFPNLTLLSLDLSLGVHVTQKRVKEFPNVHLLRASLLQLPLKDQLADFVYSYGVLHHTEDPEKGFDEAARVIKPGGRVILYLYENHAQHRVKKEMLKVVGWIRKGTVRLPPQVLYGLCRVLSPFVVLLFSWPAGLLRRFKKSRAFSEKIPFNFGRGLWSLTGDLYDRFSAPIEFRFSAETIREWYQRKGFRDVQVTRLKGIAGLVSVAERSPREVRVSP